MYAERRWMYKRDRFHTNSALTLAAGVELKDDAVSYLNYNGNYMYYLHDIKKNCSLSTECIVGFI
jgi:hypothetical protein